MAAVPGPRLRTARLPDDREAAKTLAPALYEWCAELAAVLGDAATRERLLHEARQGYEAIGAPGHAARLAAELSRS